MIARDTFNLNLPTKSDENIQECPDFTLAERHTLAV